MSTTSSSDSKDLASTVRRMLQAKAPLARSRTFIESPGEYDRDLWAALAEMGLTGLGIPEAYQGAGYGYQELCIVQEELGRLLAVVPYLSSICLAGPLLAAIGSENQKASMLPRVAAGEMIVAVAIDGVGYPSSNSLSIVGSNGRATVSGRLNYVIDGNVAEAVIATAHAEKATATLLIPLAQAGVTIQPVPALDGTRKLAHITLDGATGEPFQSGQPADRPLLGGLVCLAAEMLGGMEACLSMATEYAKVRQQFGRPIGSFQAIKHKCADMLVAVQSARSLVEYAAWTADASPTDLAVAAAAAKAFCGDAYFHAAGENIQIHGGIGFTWDHDAHLYFKRAKSSQVLLGESRYHRSVIADHVGI